MEILELNHQESYPIGAKFKDISSSALDSEAIFEIGVVVDTETMANDNRPKEKEVYGIGLITPLGYHYSHLIYKGEYEGVTEITKEEFAKITANTHTDFQYIGE